MKINTNKDDRHGRAHADKQAEKTERGKTHRNPENENIRKRRMSNKSKQEPKTQ